MQDTKWEGKIAARNSYEYDKLYGGEEELDEKEDRNEACSKLVLYVQVLCLGYKISAVIFSLELLGVFRLWTETNR